MGLVLSAPTYTVSPATTGRPYVSLPSSTLQTMFRPVVVSQSPGGLPVCSTGVSSWGATDGGGPPGESTGSPDSTPAIRFNAHSASLRNVGSIAAALSASRAASAFG